MKKIIYQRNNKGSVLISVLAIITLLAFLITSFIEDTLEDLEYRAYFEQPNNFKATAYSYLECTLAVINEIALIDDGMIHSPEQGWGNPVDYFDPSTSRDWDVRITATDATSKIPLNILSKDQLMDLLEDGLGFDFSTSQELSDSFIDWIDEDESKLLNGFESEDYLSKDPPYRSANRPLETLKELILIESWRENFFDLEGNPNEIFVLLDSLVTVIHQEPVNINSASQQVLDYLLLDTSWDIESLFATEDKPYLTKLPESLNNPLINTNTKLLNIQVTLMRGNVPFSINALVKWEPNQINVSSSNLPSNKNNIIKTGSIEQQLEISFPFEIVEINESNVF